jgi:hypothetical protein
MAATKVLAVKAGTSIDQARLPFQPACLFSLPALFCAHYKLSPLFKWIFCKLGSLEQSIFHRYLWIK